MTLHEPTPIEARETPPTRIETAHAALAAAPLAPPAVGLGLGILLDSRGCLPAAVCVLCFALGGAMLRVVRRHPVLPGLALGLAAVGAGGIVHQAAFRRVASSHVVRYTAETPVDACVTGTILAEPALYRPDYGAMNDVMPRSSRSRFLIDVDGIDGTDGTLPVCGLVRVTVHEPVLNVRAGDRVRAFGRLYRPVAPHNPQERDWRLSSRRQGVLVGLSCVHADSVTRLDDPTRRSAALLARFRRFARSLLLDDVATADPASQSLLEAMILGQRSVVDRALNDAFVRTGAVHILSVSGTHLAMLATAVWGAAALLGRSRRQSAAVVIACVVAYALLAEPNAPVIRSAITTCLLCVALMSRRPVRTGNWLAASALVILSLRPCDLFDPGFQLSFVTLGGVLYFSRALREEWRALPRRRRDALAALAPPEIGPRPLRQVIRERASALIEAALAVAIAAWMVGAPLGLHHFGQVSTWGWLNSLLIALPSAALMLAGFAKVAVSAVSPAIGSLIGPLVALLTRLLEGWVRWLAALPGVSLTPAPLPAGLALLFLAVFGLWTIRRAMRIPGHVVGVGLAGCLAATLFWRFPAHPRGDELRVRILSVGAGSAVVVQLPSGRAFLYDAGRTPPYELYSSILKPALAADGIRRLDAVLISHPNIDHYSGVADLAAGMPVREVWTTPHFARLAVGSEPAAHLLRHLEQRHIPIRPVQRGDRIRNTGPVEIEVLWPPPLESSERLDANDTSLVLRLRHHGQSILLCGDIEQKPQEWLVAHADLKADVLLLPHHGSYKRWTDAFVQAVSPSVVIRSSDRRTTDSPPGLRRLLARYSSFNTADDGAVWVRLGADGVFAEPYRSHGRTTP